MELSNNDASYTTTHMNTTQLNLLIQDTPDLKQIILNDISVYNPDLAIENPIIEITPPNFSTTYSSSYVPNKSNIFDSNVMNWSNSPIKPDLVDLPDGLWTIKQSVKPNGIFNKTYYHFRIINLKAIILNKVNSVLCDMGDAWYRDIFTYISKLEILKYMAEECNEVEKAKIMYNSIAEASSHINCDC